MLPNVFPGAGATPDYNTADASLWYIEAWRAYIEATGDEAASAPGLSGAGRDRRLAPARARATASRVDPADGLLRAGEPGVQLTWMDARGRRLGGHAAHRQAGRDQRAVVQRARRDGGDGRADRRCRTRAIRAAAERRGRVSPASLRPDGNGLYDVIDGPGGADASLRPNQIFAVSLPASPLDPAAQRAVLEAAPPLAHLLRAALAGAGRARPIAAPAPAASPSATAPITRARCGPGCSGPWALAHYRVHRRRRGGAALSRGRSAIISRDAGLGQVSEIFDGDPPHTPRGCPAQAWSVACVLEAWWRLEQAKSAASPQQLAHGLLIGGGRAAVSLAP